MSVDEIPTPVPRDDEVLVRIHAATLGVVDSLARRGAPFGTSSIHGQRRYGTGGSPGTATKMENRSKLASCTG